MVPPLTQAPELVAVPLCELQAAWVVLSVVARGFPSSYDCARRSTLPWFGVARTVSSACLDSSAAAAAASTAVRNSSSAASRVTPRGNGAPEEGPTTP